MTILAITFTIVIALYFLALGWATQRSFADVIARLGKPRIWRN